MDLGCLESLVDMPIKPSHVANPFNLECEGAPRITYVFLGVCPLLDIIGMTYMLIVHMAGAFGSKLTFHML